MIPLVRNSRSWLPALLTLPVIALFLVGYVAPISALTLKSFKVEGAWSLFHYQDIFGTEVFWLVLLRTLILAATVTAICLVVAYPFAYAIARCAPWLAAILLMAATLPYLTSILIRTYAWTVILSPAGPINQLLLKSGLISEPLRLVFNTFGLYVGMVQVQLPMMIFPLYASLSKIDRSYSAAAQSLGSPPADAFLRITLPLSVPGIVSGCTLVFLSCLGFYITPALLGGPDDYLIAQGITIRVLTLGEFESAAAQATILLIIVVGMFIVFRHRLASELDDDEGSRLMRAPRAAATLDSRSATNRVIGGLIGRLVPAALVLVSKLRWPLLVASSAFTVILLVAPFLIVVPLAFSDAAYLSFPPPAYSTRWFERLLGNAQWLEALGFSTKAALFAAVIAIVTGLPAAFVLVRQRFLGRVGFYLLLISPLIVPHVVMAVAMFFGFAGTPLIGTTGAFVLSYAIIATPYVVVIFTAALKRFDRSLERAGASCGATPLVVLRTVTIPLLMPSVASAFLFAFITGFDDVVFGLFLSGPGATPLPIRMWDDIRLEISPQIAAVAVLFVGVLAMISLARVVYVALRHSKEA